jgi:hypothetical protein
MPLPGTLPPRELPRGRGLEPVAMITFLALNRLESVNFHRSGFQVDIIDFNGGPKFDSVRFGLFAHVMAEHVAVLRLDESRIVGYQMGGRHITAGKGRIHENGVHMGRVR